ncbi:MAG: methyl-accepting chemotaxis protein [Pirellulaceae bacterium]|jgi:methyl-accepting chemotaxis protein
MQSNRSSASNRFILALVGIAIFATIFGGVGFVRQAWMNEMEIRQAELVAIGSSIAFSAPAVIEFQQMDAAQLLLDELGEFPQILAATLFDITGKSLANHTTATAMEPLEVPSNYGARTTKNGNCEVASPVRSGTEIVGIIVLRGQQPSFLSVLQQFSVPLLGMVLVLSLGALTVGQQFQNRIIVQSSALAETLRRLADEPDTSHRILLSDDDEFAEVSYELNRLLEKLDYSNQDPHVRSNAPAMLGVMYLSNEGIIDFCDIGATAILERSTAKVVGQHAAEFLSQLDGEMIERILRDVERTGRAYSFRASVVSTIGSTTPLHVSIRSIAVKDRTMFHLAMTNLHSGVDFDPNSLRVQPEIFRRDVA